MTKASNANGDLHVLEFECTVILATFVRYVQKTTSHISFNFETVALLSKFVRLDSEICFESNLNEGIKCLGFCGTRKQIFSEMYLEWLSCVLFLRIRISGVRFFFVVCPKT